MTCDLGDLENGASRTVKAKARGTLGNLVRVSSSVADPNSANNLVSVVTSVR